jgi:plastocyanin
MRIRETALATVLLAFMTMASCAAPSTPAASGQPTATAIPLVASAATGTALATMTMAPPTPAPTATQAPAITTAPTVTDMRQATTSPATARPAETTAAPPPQTAATGAKAAMTVNVKIKLFDFEPRTIDVPEGATVVWTNLDLIEHTVTAGEPTAPTKLFGSPRLAQGTSFSYTFTKAGDYPYFCTPHPTMRGLVHVHK